MSLTCRCSCQHRRLGNLFGFCDEMVSGDNKLPDICQRECAQGRGQRRDKRREGKKQKILCLFSRRSLEKLPTDFPLYLMFLLCSRAGLFVQSEAETAVATARCTVATFVAFAVADAACLIPRFDDSQLYFPLMHRLFIQRRTLPQRLPQLQLPTVSADSHLGLGIIFARNSNSNLAWRFGPS